jgi:hypothetical protein
MADLTKALRQLREERSRTQNHLRQLDEAILVLGKVVSGSGRSKKDGRHAPRKLSAAARRRIAEAQKARWAKWRSRRGKKTA